MSDSAVPWVKGWTIGAALHETARQHPDQDAVVFCATGVRCSWADFDRRVDDAARALMALGFQKGDHFGVWSGNCLEWVILQFATARIGVVLVTINPSYRASELRYALAQSEVRGLALSDRFKSADYAAIFQEACPDFANASAGVLRNDQFPKLQWLISLRGHISGTLTWDKLLARATAVPTNDLARREAELVADDPINIQYTSGTTGFPKGAMLSHANILVNGFYAGANQRFTPLDRLCIPVPLYHCFGCVLGTLCCVALGSTMVFPSESFDAGATLLAIESERCTAIYGVPTMFIAMLEHPEYAQRDLSSLRTGIMAGSPCPIELMKRVTHEMGASEITIGYGQTEASPLVTQTVTDDPIELRVGTVGRALPDVEVKIIDPETGRVLPDGQSGELCCRGHVVMLGYFNLPQKTAEAIDADGWLHSGDLVLRTPEGYFRITGRLKDLIIRGGENIYPREIEERLYQHPAIEDVQIVGIPDRKYGEEVLAWIKLRPGSSVTEQDLRDFCRASLAHYKTPRHIKFVDSFPTTVTGKIQKYKIRELAIQELGLQDAAQIETA